MPPDHARDVRSARDPSHRKPAFAPTVERSSRRVPISPSSIGRRRPQGAPFDTKRARRAVRVASTVSHGKRRSVPGVATASRGRRGARRNHPSGGGTQCPAKRRARRSTPARRRSRSGSTICGGKGNSPRSNFADSANGSSRGGMRMGGSPHPQPLPGVPRPIRRGKRSDARGRKPRPRPWISRHRGTVSRKGGRGAPPRKKAGTCSTAESRRSSKN